MTQHSNCAKTPMFTEASEKNDQTKWIGLNNSAVVAVSTDLEHGSQEESPDWIDCVRVRLTQSPDGVLDHATSSKFVFFTFAKGGPAPGSRAMSVQYLVLTKCI